MSDRQDATELATKSTGWQALRYAACTAQLVWLVGCAETIPPGRYGVNSLRIRGSETLDEDSLAACLATQPRERFSFKLGPNPLPECNVPPFDAGGLRIALWSWPWSDWPLFDNAVVERDLQRIERWYRARGYYDARVVRTQATRNEREKTVDLEIELREGEPVRVSELRVTGIDALPARQQSNVHEALRIELGEPFDEALYERSKEAIRLVLEEAAYAKAAVSGRVQIDPKQRQASVAFAALPGPKCVFGTVRVQGQGPLSTRAIRGAAALEAGTDYSLKQLQEAQRAVYALGPFASVELTPVVRAESNVVDVLAHVVPARRFRFGVGAGIAAGQPDTWTDTIDPSVAQWDTHLLLRADHRNFLGGMRRLRIEDRPRLIFKNSFPHLRSEVGTGQQGAGPTLGNLLFAEFRQPGFILERMRLRSAVRYDIGPDPFEGFERHDVSGWIGPEQSFLGGTLNLAATLHLNLQVPQQESKRVAYTVTYMQYDAVLDLRDNPISPRRGAYLGLSVQHASNVLGPLKLPSSWSYLRLTPQARLYVPLPAGIVLAARARLGFMHIGFASDSLRRDCSTETNRAECEAQNLALTKLGPVNQRLRGGGANSVRGFAANQLGEVLAYGTSLVSGGLRQWEASLELRTPITANLGAAFFIDVGDVSGMSLPASEARFRLDHPNTSLGLGLRYRTLIGPVRFDMAFLVPGLQGPPPRHASCADAPATTPCVPSQRNGVLGVASGAVHITIGESF
ncbi:MAG: BamA/TamA family outer membrane protein [Proteobacteria bacterium]|nr:BamA/TamA family outer membrane protein [Pseudomonadota bacterium]